MAALPANWCMTASNRHETLPLKRMRTILKWSRLGMTMKRLKQSIGRASQRTPPATSYQVSVACRLAVSPVIACQFRGPILRAGTCLRLLKKRGLALTVSIQWRKGLVVMSSYGGPSAAPFPWGAEAERSTGSSTTRTW